MYKRGVVMSGVVSLTMGNSSLPFGHGLVCDIEPVCQLFLGQALFFPQLGHKGPKAYVIHGMTSLIFLYYEHCRRKKQPTKSREAVFD